MTERSKVTVQDLETRFAPVFALKAESKVFDPDDPVLTASDLRAAWNALNDAVPAVVAHCQCFSTKPEDNDQSKMISLWDFMSGREVRICINKRGGYDLSVLAEHGEWSETQLSLDVLLLKLLALDYLPEQFRAFSC